MTAISNLEKRSRRSDTDQLSAPDVTVIVICYNDAEHLSSAVQSALNQTLKNLEVIISDDHSSDNTTEVAARLSAADSRVRYHRLSENSGGCGAPRNRALELARGKYVLFLDSDDLLERHACKNLLLEAEKNGADIVSGRMVRVYVDEDGREEPWYERLYRERVFFSSIDERPQQTHDTAVTNKLYKLEFFYRTGIRFPEHIHYEDLVFSAQSLSAAVGISIIPETVYIWNVYPSEVRKSISNQRDAMKNLIDRLYAVEIAVKVYASHSRQVVSEMEDKILMHHLRLYINDMKFQLENWCISTLETISPLLESLPIEAYDRLSIPERVLYASVLEKDLFAIRQLLLGISHRALHGRVYSTSTGTYWALNGPDTRPNNSSVSAHLSDLTRFQIHNESHAQLHYSHRVTSYEVVGKEYVLEGESSDPLGKLSTAGSKLRILLRSPSGRSEVSGTSSLSPSASGTSWKVRFPLPSRASLREREGRHFIVQTSLAGGALNEAPLRFDEAVVKALRLKEQSLFGRLLQDSWVISSAAEAPGVMEIQPSNQGAALRRLLRKFVGSRPSIRSRADRIRFALRPTGKIGLTKIYPLLRKLPIKRNLCLFESNMGKSAFENPRAVHEILKAKRPDLVTVWSWAGSPAVEKDLPTRNIIRRDSFAYIYALARAHYLIENQGFPSYFVKRPGQRYLQTWHGIPFKKMGFDEPRFASSRSARALQSKTDQWDGLNIASPYFEKVFVPAFGFTGVPIRYGSPRLDDLTSGTKSSEVIRSRLDLPPNRKIVLYAPTYREDERSGSSFKLHIDLLRWEEIFGGEVTLLVRAHYLSHLTVPDQFKGICLDVSDYGDITDLYAISDVLITDYSSVMFDYAQLNRPIVIFAPDYSQYTERSRGSYFNLRQSPPGPFTTTLDELFDALPHQLNLKSAGPELEKFRRKFSGTEDGLAASRSVKFLLDEEIV